MSLRASTSLLLALAVAACDSPRRPGGVAPPSTRRDAAPVDEDGGAELDEAGLGADGGDGSRPNDDAMSLDFGFTDAQGAPDQGFEDARSADASAPDAAAPDAAAADAAAPDARADGGPQSPECAELGRCCPFAGPLQPSCEASAMGGDAAQCAQTLMSLRQFGVCQGDAGVGRDAAPRDASPAFDGGGGPGACASLALCCPNSATPQDCAMIAFAGIDFICGLLLVQEQAAGSCPP